MPRWLLITILKINSRILKFMEVMGIIYIVLAFAAALLGILGAIVPVIPGAIVSYLSIIIVYFGVEGDITLSALIGWGVIVLVVSIIDMVVPPILTRAVGGSKSSATGSLVGTLVGAFFIPPFGMILGAFFGAMVGEWLVTRQLGHKEFRVALGSFAGFILGTGLKLIVSVMILIYLMYKILIA